jgi:hypothetical protein
MVTLESLRALRAAAGRPLASGKERTRITIRLRPRRNSTNGRPGEPWRESWKGRLSVNRDSTVSLSERAANLKSQLG